MNEDFFLCASACFPKNYPRTMGPKPFLKIASDIQFHTLANVLNKCVAMHWSE